MTPTTPQTSGNGVPATNATQTPGDEQNGPNNSEVDPMLCQQLLLGDKTTHHQGTNEEKKQHFHPGQYISSPHSL